MKYFLNGHHSDAPNIPLGKNLETIHRKLNKILHDSIRIDGYNDKEYADQVVSIINKKYNSADELMNDYNDIHEEYTMEKKGDVGRKSKKIKLNVYSSHVNMSMILIAAKNEKLAKEYILSLPPIYNRFSKKLEKINNVFFESNESETKIIMESCG